MVNQLFDFVFCCLSEDQKEQISRNIPADIYHAQMNLVQEKHGYRCTKCGKVYPFLRLDYENTLTDPKAYAKPSGRVLKGKKAADVFCGSFYYAKNKKTMQKYQLDPSGAFVQTDAIPVMDDVYLTIISRDGRFLATETFGGTISIIDVQTRQTVAKKTGRKIRDAFIFDEQNRLLYFFDAAVRCWDFSEQEEKVLWQVPDAWKLGEDPPKRIPVVCRNVTYNASEQACIFTFGAGSRIYAVFFQNSEVRKTVPLPCAPVHCELIYSEGANQYTLCEKGCVKVYDPDFSLVEKLPAPVFRIIHDGGGVFPITRHETSQPGRTFLSPDGKWLLLDYFNYLILMGREDRKIRFCLYSYAGKVTRQMGFVDCEHIWYTWGDTTYIQQIL